MRISDWSSDVCSSDLWLTIFELELSRFDAYPHLATLSALHLALYELAVAADFCAEPRPSFVCEVVAPRKTLVRELRSEERRVGKECVSPRRSRWSQYH